MSSAGKASSAPLNGERERKKERQTEREIEIEERSFLETIESIKFPDAVSKPGCSVLCYRLFRHTVLT